MTKLGLDECFGRVALEGEALKATASRIAKQHPLEGHKSSKLSAHSSLKEMPKEGDNVAGDSMSEYLSKFMFLTPDQLNALRGPLRQLIFGAAGTGKTIILQAKAL